MAGHTGNAASARTLVGTGRVLMWRGGSVWVSRDTGPARAHAHHAIQVTLAPVQPVRLRSGEGGAWLETAAAIVMPDQPHQFDGLGGDVIMVFVEPETTAGRSLRARLGAAPLSPIDDPALLRRAGSLLQAFAAQAADEVIVQGACGIVDHLAGGLPAAPDMDRRIAAALEWIRERLDAPISLAQAAAIAHLSPSRFRHLFVAHTGISFRAYLLWARVSRAIVMGMEGGSWTEAAQRAGFADSAHFSRTCRRMFGVAPSMLGRE